MDDATAVAVHTQAGGPDAGRTDRGPGVLPGDDGALPGRAARRRTRCAPCATTPAGFDPAYWRRGAELGWTSLLVGEDHGGGTISGAGLVDLSLVAYEFGRHAAPGPLVATNVVAVGPERPRRRTPTCWPACWPGEPIATWCIPEFGPRARRLAHRRRAAPRRGRLRARAARCARWSRPARPTTSSSVRRRRTETATGALTQVLVPASAGGVSVTPMETVDLTRRFGAVDLRRRDGSARTPGGGAGRGRRRRGAPVPGGRSSCSTPRRSGAMQAGFDMTVEWAFDRYTFGRPLASYQALKHRFADMMTWLEASHAISDAACVAAADGAAQAGELLERGQGLHRPVRRRAAAGLRADPRRHRRDLRARPPPLPAPLHRRPLAGRDAGGRTASTIASPRRGTRGGRGMSAVRGRGGPTIGRGGGPRELPPAGARASSGPTSARSRTEELRWDSRHASEEEELAEVAHERELQRMLFDAGLAGICFPREYGGQGLTPGAPAGAERGAGRLRVPAPNPGADLLAVRHGPPRVRHRGAEAAAISRHLAR